MDHDLLWLYDFLGKKAEQTRFLSFDDVKINSSVLHNGWSFVVTQRNPTSQNVRISEPGSRISEPWTNQRWVHWTEIRPDHSRSYSQDQP